MLDLSLCGFDGAKLRKMTIQFLKVNAKSG